jgi:hypothetical protein
MGHWIVSVVFAAIILCWPFIKGGKEDVKPKPKRQKVPDTQLSEAYERGFKDGMEA